MPNDEGWCIVRIGRLAPRVVAFLAFVAVVALLVSGSSAAPAARGLRPNRWVVPTRAVEIALIGDSLSTGYATPGDPWTKYATALFAKRHRSVNFVNASQNGAGYGTAGVDGDTFADEAAKVVNPATKIVVLFGSDNDVSQPALAAAVRTTLTTVHAAAPHAAVIVVGPPAPPAQEMRVVAGIRDVLKVAAAAAGAQFVDPLALKWLSGESAGGVGPDSEHPNLAGERYLAEQMTRVLAPAVDRLFHR